MTAKSGSKAPLYRRPILASLAFLVFVLSALGVWIVQNIEIDYKYSSIQESRDYLGCYFFKDSVIVLDANFAEFDGSKIPVSYGNRKVLGEVLIPETYPWYDTGQNKIVLLNDNLALVDIVESNNYDWKLEIINYDYLMSKGESEFGVTFFTKGDCV